MTFILIAYNAITIFVAKKTCTARLEEGDVGPNGRLVIIILKQSK